MDKVFDVNIYIETTIKSANVGSGKYGYVVEFITKDEVPVTRSSIEEELNITANQLNLVACIRALEILKKPCQITIFTNSKYVENGINTWMHNWYQNDWINAKGDHIKNMDLWKPLHNAARQHFIKVENVKAHNYSVWLRDEMRKKENVKSDTD
jgi:ribonuclease HI